MKLNERQWVDLAYKKLNCSIGKICGFRSIAAMNLLRLRIARFSSQWQT